MKTFKIGGIHPQENKLSISVRIENVPIPEQVIIPLDQHIGAPSTPVVVVGDKVKVGQLIGKATGFMSANTHSSVSGTVSRIDTYIDSFGYKKPAIYINVEGDEWLEGIDTSNKLLYNCTLSSKEIIQKINDAGIVGLGGACFPTHIKLCPPSNCKIDTLIINAVECEPYLTHNHQLMIEKGEEIIVGVNILMKALEVEKAIIGIEENKANAIEYLKKITLSNKNIEVVTLKTKYPQGGEKQLIQACTNREVKSGALPASVGVVVQNVATVYAVYEAVQLNKPLIEVFVTISGPELLHPGNFKMRIGTLLSDALKMAGGMPENTKKIIGGGPMMGRAFLTADIPATKRSSGLLLLPEKLAKRLEPSTCIRCGKCVYACPMGLEPFLLGRLSELQIWDKLEESHVTDCIECGSCMFTCPSHRPILDYVRMGKSEVMSIIKSRATK
ncbi:MAG: Electron transport complex protein RnfC [Bacteroidetes bacterium ADurb.Bin302]|nr:MAG: Electron transport complex protein RnfC [Bacteroidetes bacterium ADurb.Bin302]